MSESKTFECWAVVSQMGHRTFAGFVTEQPIGGSSLIRIDVPAVIVDGAELPAFTKLLGTRSIFDITPCTEETARAFAAQSRQRAFSVYEAPRLPAPQTESCPQCGYRTCECICGIPGEDDDEDDDDFDNDGDE